MRGVSGLGKKISLTCFQGEVYSPRSFTSVGEITGLELRFNTYLKGVETLHVVLPEQNSINSTFGSSACLVYKEKDPGTHREKGMVLPPG